MIKIILSLLLILSAVPALAGTTTVIGMNERSYRLYVPTGVASPAKLVIALHPGLNNASSFQSHATLGMNSTLDAAADTGLFMVAYVDGTGRSASFETWDAGWCCGFANEIGVRDLENLNRIILHLSQTQDIDETKIYLFGYSNGAMLAYNYICHYPTEIAGMVVAAGALVIDHDDCAGTVVVPVTHVYGVNDTTVPPAGGTNSTGEYFTSLSSTESFLEGRGATITTIALTGTDHTLANIQSGLSAQQGTDLATLVQDMVSP